MLQDSTSSNENSASVAQSERRQHARYSFSASAEAVHVEADTRLEGRVSDLSRGGCYIDTINPFPIGATVNLRISKDEMIFVAEARVFYAVIGMGMGMGFLKIEDEQVPILERWLAQFGEGQMPEEATPLRAPSSGPAGVSGVEATYVLNELIVSLMRKRVLTEAEGKAMLRRLAE